MTNTVVRLNNGSRITVSDQMTKEVVRSLSQVGAAFRQFGKTVSSSHFFIKQFEQAIVEASERCYLAHHKRLPGTNRTSRGRKKRRSVIANWMNRNPNKRDGLAVIDSCSGNMT